MPYFFILPLYVLFVFGAVASILVAYFRPEWRHAVPALSWGLFGSFVGLIAFNVLVNAAGFLLLVAFGEETGTLADATKIFGGITLILGPLLASLVGVLGGYALGFRHGHKKRKLAA